MLPFCLSAFFLFICLFHPLIRRGAYSKCTYILRKALSYICISFKSGIFQNTFNPNRSLFRKAFNSRVHCFLKEIQKYLDFACLRPLSQSINSSFYQIKNLLKYWIFHRHIFRERGTLVGNSFPGCMEVTFRHYTGRRLHTVDNFSFAAYYLETLFSALSTQITYVCTVYWNNLLEPRWLKMHNHKV